MVTGATGVAAAGVLEVRARVTVHGQLVMVKVVAWRRCCQYKRSSDIQKPLETHLSDGVGDTVVGDLGGSWAVGGVLGDDVGNVDGTVGLGRGTGDESSSSGSNGETHLDGIKGGVGG